MGASRQTIEQATVGIALLVLVSKAVGFLREIIVAYKFGTSIEYDVYLIAVSIPMAFFVWFGTSISNLFIPEYARAVAGPDREGALRRLWGDFNLSLMSSVVIMAAIIAFASHLIRLIAPGLDSAYLPETVYMLRVSSVIVILAVLGAFLRSILNAEKHFLIPAAGPILFNLVIIGFIVGFSGELSTRAILYGMVTGYFAQVAINLLPIFKTGIFRVAHAKFMRPRMERFFLLAAAILIIEGTAQLYAIIDRFFASSMEAGVVSALGYSYNLIMLPVMVFAYALSTAIFPYMSDAFAGHASERSSRLLARGIGVSLLFALPAMIIFWVFAYPVVKLFFQRGAFDAESLELTWRLVRYFALGLAGQFLMWILSRACYASGKYGLLLTAVLVALVVKASVAPLTIRAFGFTGLAISTSLSYTIGGILLLAGIRRQLLASDRSEALIYVLKVMLSAATAFVIAILLSGILETDSKELTALLFWVIFGAGGTLFVYLTAAWFFGIPDIRQVIDRLRRR